MRTYAMKPKAIRQLRPLGLPKLSCPHGAQSKQVKSILRGQRTVGNQQIQAKPAVNQPGDKYEKEGDRIAESVIRMPAPAPAHHHDSCAASQSGVPAVQRKCAACEEEDRVLQRKAEGGNAAPVPSSNPVPGQGAPLQSAERAYFEPRFGHDFGNVRVHTDARAAQAARDVQAQAYTFGRHIVFAAGRFAPGTRDGRRLLAHELAHVLQQRGEPVAVQRQPDATESTEGTSIFADIGNLFRPGRWAEARECLTRLFEPMRTNTFNRWIAHACARTGRDRLHAREWDAFGHCWIACEGTRQCGGPQTWTFGFGRELQREWERISGVRPHDSFRQDVANQVIGRVASVQDGTCYSICDDLHSSGLLDLSAPVRNCVDCHDLARGEFPCTSETP